MAIGQLINSFRMRKGMTQKHHKEQIGFEGGTSDVRMAQYESEARVTKDDLAVRIADILGTTPKNLTVPDIYTNLGMLYTHHINEEERCTVTNIETFYLIDYENVNESGLACSKQLGSHDHIHIFFTENAQKIGLKILTAFDDTDFNTHIVPSGKQSLDKHIVAYLGYLIGKNNSQNCKYIIVSKDKDYDNIISFLKKLSSSEITRQIRIGASAKKLTTTKVISISSKKSPPNQKVQLNNEIQRSIVTAGYDAKTSNKVASIVAKHYSDERFSNTVHNELRATFADYTEIYKIVKPIIKKYASDIPHKEPAISQLNAKVKEALIKASYDKNTISYVASIICKHQDEKKAKQAIYNSIIAKYGQKQGLNIYNHIKKIL